ncbi:MAG: BON domain-containing protein [Sedimentisphaerales bacterium]
MAVITRTNEDIKKDIVDQLYWDARVDASNVEVAVSDGQVSLTGTVPNHTAYLAASEDAWAMSGVKNVRNQLQIEYPSGFEVPKDAELKVNIENLLLWQPNIDSTYMDVLVDKGWITLRGSVDAYWKKIRAEEIVLGLKGVIGLTNELAIVPTREFTDKVIAKNIEAALERNAGTDVDMIDVQVENGKVILSGSVSSLPAYRESKKIAENTPGVVMVSNELIIR